MADVDSRITALEARLGESSGVSASVSPSQGANVSLSSGCLGLVVVLLLMYVALMSWEDYCAKKSAPSISSGRFRSRRGRLNLPPELTKRKPFRSRVEEEEEQDPRYATIGGGGRMRSRLNLPPELVKRKPFRSRNEVSGAPEEEAVIVKKQEVDTSLSRWASVPSGGNRMRSKMLSSRGDGPRFEKYPQKAFTQDTVDEFGNPVSRDSHSRSVDYAGLNQYDPAKISLEDSVFTSHQDFVTESGIGTQGASHQSIMDHDDTLQQWVGLRKPYYGQGSVGKAEDGAGAVPGMDARQVPSESPEQMNEKQMFLL